MRLPFATPPRPRTAKPRSSSRRPPARCAAPARPLRAAVRARKRRAGCAAAPPASGRFARSSPGCAAARSRRPCAAPAGVPARAPGESALAQPCRRQRNREHQVGLLDRRLDPGCAAQQRRERGGPACVAAELELRDAFRPRPAIGASHQAGVERRRRVQDAVAALRNAGRHRQRTGGAARNGWSEARHAAVAHRPRGPGAAHGALARQALEQCGERTFDPRLEHGSIY